MLSGCGSAVAAVVKAPSGQLEPASPSASGIMPISWSFVPEEPSEKATALIIASLDGSVADVVRNETELVQFGVSVTPASSWRILL